jgi:hypothetical protein
MVSVLENPNVKQVSSGSLPQDFSKLYFSRSLKVSWETSRKGVAHVFKVQLVVKKRNRDKRKLLKPRPLNADRNFLCLMKIFKDKKCLIFLSLVRFQLTLLRVCHYLTAKQTFY